MRLALAIFQQAINKSDGGKGFTGTGGHLYQGFWPAFFKGFFQVIDGNDLAISQSIFRQCGNILQSCP